MLSATRATQDLVHWIDGNGRALTRMAGVKKLSLELGASCPVIIMPDADSSWRTSAVAAVATSKPARMHLCSTGLAHPAVSGDSSMLVPKVQGHSRGRPSSPRRGWGH